MNDQPGADDPTFASRLLESLPAAVFVIDEVGTISFASRRAAELVGREPAEVIGESVLQFVAADTAWAYAAAVAMATDYADAIMGPLRVTFAGEGQAPVTAELWATNHLDDPDVRGIVCTINPETTAMGLLEAVAALAGREPLDEIVARVVTALKGHPVAADAVLYRHTGDRLQPAAAAPTQVDALGGSGVEALCASATEHGARRLSLDLSDLPGDRREAALAEGYRSLWVEPVGSEPEGAVAALALWRRHDETPSPNELNAVYKAASILTLALTLDLPPTSS